MARRFGLGLGLALMFGLCLAATNSSAAEKPASIVGTWQLIYAEKDGKVTADDVVGKIKVTLTDKDHTVTMGDQTLASKVPYAVDLTKSPHQVTDTIPDGPNEGKQIHSIFRLDDNFLFSCVSPIGKEAPATFEAKEGSGQTLRVFRRVAEGDLAKVAKIKDEQAKFNGVWAFKSMVMGGKDLPLAAFKSAKMTLKHNQFTTVQGGVSYDGIYIVDPTATPKTIDIVFIHGPEKAKVTRGVYTLEGDVYTICVGLGETTRPQALESKAGTTNVLEVLTREKP